MADDAFSLLHRGVQRALWDKKWPSLRPLQVEAIRLLLRTDRHAVLAAATASGKTEAAFLPILSRIADEPHGSVRALYVGPLKALINDQFGRVEELCAHLDVPVHRWHGDVGAAAKARLVDRPSGVLLITPESVESLFVNRSNRLPSLFAGLRFVVIDELHAFLDNERGLHLQSLLARLRSLVVGPPCRAVGLSATLGDFAPARAYLAPDAADRVEVVVGDAGETELRMKLHAFRVLSAGGDEPGGVEGAGDHPRPSSLATDDAAEPPATTRDKAEAVIRHFGGRASLVFANAKGEVEELADVCQRICERRRLPHRFLVHHGSLSAELREETEATMKDGVPATTFCSSTLEMGVDIGSVEAVGQVGAPFTVASLKQRVGRSGRRAGAARVLRLYVECPEPGPKAGLFPRLQAELLRAVAVAELMLAGWVEPPAPPRCDLSTLTQQVISVIAERGAARADQLHTLLCRSGPFRDVEPALFGRLLRRLVAEDVIEQDAQGELILGLVGERLRKDKAFYAVFPTPETYAILWEGRHLGELNIVPREGDRLVFGGRRWTVLGVDDEAMAVHVVPARGYKLAAFGGTAGALHDRVAAKMREILGTDARYAYLDEAATTVLESARTVAREAGVCDRRLIELGGAKTAVMTWAGTRARLTLSAMLRSVDLAADDEEIALVLPAGPAEARAVLRRCAGLEFDTAHLARLLGPAVPARKYDAVLGPELTSESIVRGWLDVEGARRCLATI